MDNTSSILKKRRHKVKDRSKSEEVDENDRNTFHKFFK